MASTSGPWAGFDDLERRTLITNILNSLKAYELQWGFAPGSMAINSPVWFALWLADLSNLEKIAAAFAENPNGTRLEHNEVVPHLLTLWLPTSGIGSRFPKSRPGSSTPTSPVDDNPSNSAPNSPTGPRTPTGRALMSFTPAKSSPLMPMGKKRKLDMEASPGSPKPKASEPSQKDLSDKVRARDDVCIITKATEPLEAAHILPSQLCKNAHSGESKFSKFLALLAYFWSPEKINKWLSHKEDVFNSVANRLALAPSCHAYWDNGLFGLLPIRVAPDEMSMQVQFYWLRGENLPATGHSLLLENDDENFIIPPIVLPSDLRKGGRKYNPDTHNAPNLILVNNDTECVISSGDVIELTTPDPESLPLPNEDLLELQWTLHRLSALCAAAGWQPPDYDDDDDDDNTDEAAAVNTPPYHELKDLSEMTESKRAYLQERFASGTNRNCDLK
ncbi:hypothetical protein ASPZODRAFT_21730 [Penicilliopsis zonata CBS 506.65]|uniref:HNH nuclease domain-containing protein n=1 Tax=Penicilliopsis zonata CBS 506.65 TaxID=1073090 RepID=A0A1L9SVS5_9EURO|nr:hypothetical protein ASPZODRAFT_21730 [Penicilliopsis zonata CBS 506.65]OJJ51244.1 hypothetical protein ASPZODRAFT_21730 [Penicilliopsis zonata CBS 506.65]